MSEELFLAQYNQVWEQRRGHVGHIWAIPTTVTALTGILITLWVSGKISFSLHFEWKILSLTFVYLGFFGIFCRHNFFIRVLGLLLKDLARKPKAWKNLPQFGSEFRRRYRRDLTSCLDIFGSWRSGTFWWGMTVFGILLFIFLTWALPRI